MASKALPALVLLALVCGELVTGGHAQALIGGAAGVRRPLPYARGSGSAQAGMQPLPYPRGSGSAQAGTQPPPYTTQPSTSGDVGTGRLSSVEEEKAFMIHSLPARERPVPVPPTSNQ